MQILSADLHVALPFRESRNFVNTDNSLPGFPGRYVENCRPLKRFFRFVYVLENSIRTVHDQSGIFNHFYCNMLFDGMQALHGLESRINQGLTLPRIPAKTVH